MIRFAFPFLIIIFVELIILFGLDYYNNILSNRNLNLQEALDFQEKNLLFNIKNNQSYLVFSQIAHIKDIWQKRKSVAKMMTNLKTKLPNFMEIEFLEYNHKKRDLALSLKVTDLRDYVKVINYFQNAEDFELTEFTAPKISGRNVEFQIKLFLKDNLYQ